MKGRAIVFSLILFSITLIFWYCNAGTQEKKAEEKTAPLSISDNSGDFNRSFRELLNTYYSLKDAFIDEDTVKINAAATTLLLNANNLKINEVKGDSTGMIRETARYFAETISGSAEAVAGEESIGEKRKELNMITDAIWSLIRTVQYDGEKVYYQYCPTAFDNAGAYWLSNKRDSRNPYLGKGMTECGEVADSLDYSKR